jgi:hypothetical protein
VQPSAAATTTGAAGALGWLLLLFLALAGLVVGLVVRRSRRAAAWDAEAYAATAATRTLTDLRLPPVLTAQSAGERALTWPLVRDDLIGQANRWGSLADQAPDDQRRESAGWLAGLLQELVVAVDAESQALATGREWRLLRPRVDAAGQAVAAALAGLATPAPPPAGEPGPAAYP